MKPTKALIPLLWGLILLPFFSYSQSQSDSLPTQITLDECIQYALRHQPVFQQSVLDQQITERTIRATLSAWLPQIRAEYNLQHYLILPVSFFPNFNDPTGPRQAVRVGLENTSNLLLQADQTLYSPDVMLASKAARFSRQQATQLTENERISLVVEVGKAFYGVLLTKDQLGVLNENISRLEQLQKDAFERYEAGINDKIDYQRAGVSLNNARSQKKGVEENVKVRYAYLKQLMGVPAERSLEVRFDTTQIRQEVLVDTLQQLRFEERIEYQLLQTQLQLQQLNAKYQQWSYLPTVSAFINYNFVYQNNSFPELYSQNFPNSVAGLRVALPIFQGTRRVQNLQKARLQIRRLELDIAYTKSQLATQYEEAMAVYKSNLNEWKTQETNLEVAREVYNTVKLQYDEGIKPYLDVITSETDLRASQLNYLNALYNVLSSKLDVQRALGTIPGR
jgi:outer membrane protein